LDHKDIKVAPDRWVHKVLVGIKVHKGFWGMMVRKVMMAVKDILDIPVVQVVRVVRVLLGILVVRGIRVIPVILR
jgi:hypothetical protein